MSLSGGVDGLEERVDALENESVILGERVNATEHALGNHTQQIARLNESLSRLNMSLSRLDELEGLLSLLKDSVGRLNMSFEELVEQMNYTQREWLRELSSLAERQGSLEKEVKVQGRQFDEKVSSISQRLDDTRSDLDELRLKVVELEKELEAREQEIMRLRRCGLILSISFLASIILAEGHEGRGCAKGGGLRGRPRPPNFISLGRGIVIGARPAGRGGPKMGWGQVHLILLEDA